MINRRQALAGLTASAALAALPNTISAASANKTNKDKEAFKYALNLSTIRGHKLGFMKEIEVASKAGFRHVEIWIDSLQKYLDEGGTTADARKHLDASGVQVEDAIGFAPWIVDDAATRQKAVEQLKREMGMLAEIGCERIAAPPMGATNENLPDLKKIAERYRAILDLGDQTGVVPQLELWGFSKTLSRLSELMYVAIESGSPSARVLMDVYHLYRGGSGLTQAAWVGKPFIEVFHVNDYPATPAQNVITDASRVYPGDGIAPLKALFAILKNPEKPVILSLEVFNPAYYAQDALEVAKTGLAKMMEATREI